MADTDRQPEQDAPGQEPVTYAYAQPATASGGNLPADED